MLRTAHKMAQNCIAFCVQIPCILAKFNSFFVIYRAVIAYSRIVLGKLRSFSGIQKFPCIVCNSKFHYRVYKSSQHVLFLSQINPTHIFVSCSFKTSFNVIFLYMLTARAEVRGGPAGQLPRVPTYNGLQDVTVIIRNNGDNQVSARKNISPKIIHNFGM